MNSKEQKVIMRSAKAGGKVIRSYFGKALTIVEKSVAQDVRTEADVGSETAIITILEKAFPKYNILSEECGMIDRKSEYTFYIDPLDGTNNFTLGIPNFSVSIALVRGTETIFGLVYLPMINLMYHSMKGSGAFCNGIKIKPSSETVLVRSTSAFLCGYHCPKSFVIKTLARLSRRTKRVLINWSVASDFCSVASGKIETVVNRKTELYDFLAAKLIAKEAGCVVTDFTGKPEKNDLNHTFLTSNNMVIHEKALRMLTH